MQYPISKLNTILDSFSINRKWPETKLKDDAPPQPHPVSESVCTVCPEENWAGVLEESKVNEY